jgi:hypothetical protein
MGRVDSSTAECWHLLLRINNAIASAGQSQLIENDVMWMITGPQIEPQGCYTCLT